MPPRLRAGLCLESLDNAAAFRDVLTGLDDPGCMSGIHDACARPIVYSRHHWLKWKDEYRVRADLSAALESIFARQPGQWDLEESDLALSLFAMDMSSVGLDELREFIDTSAVRDVLTQRYRLYADALDATEGPAATLLGLARGVDQLRARVQVDYEPYSIIDGREWYRTEGLLRRDDVETSELTPHLATRISEWVPDSASLSSEQALQAATRASIAVYGESAPVIRDIMDATLADTQLLADHVTLICPQGDTLENPQDMTTSAAFYTETRLRDGLDLAAYSARMGHESEDQMARTIRARMLKLKRGAIRSLYGPGCMQGQFIEKHGGNMIFRNEDAHYRGHKSIACSSGGRASFAARYSRGGDSHELSPMFGDFRAVRMTDDVNLTFTGDGLRQLMRYTEWIRIVVEETYRRGERLQLSG